MYDFIGPHETLTRSRRYQFQFDGEDPIFFFEVYEFLNPESGDETYGFRGHISGSRWPGDPQAPEAVPAEARRRMRTGDSVEAVLDLLARDARELRPSICRPWSGGGAG